MPPTTKFKKFRKMLDQEESDLTMALTHLFTPTGVPPTFPVAPASVTALKVANFFQNNLDPTGPIWLDIENALGIIAPQVPEEPPDPVKVREHIDNWPNTVEMGNGKEQIRETLCLILDPTTNPDTYGAEFKWKLFKGEGGDQIIIKLKRDKATGEIKKTVKITFLNSWENVTGDVEITVGP